ncbi:hypothetical protein [Zhongshania sp. BJYM1]|uniref:hypothetical protein n=1 Tax=Zhongshania aquatica TaxID=2965069 RepID=UPI0022B4548B|nr:hypothetical protein [Marortus sp. BJYM1]
MNSTRRYYWTNEISEKVSQLVVYIREHIGSASYMACELDEGTIRNLVEGISASMEISGTRFDLAFSEEYVFICSHFDRHGQYLLVDFYGGRLNFTSPDYVFTLKALAAAMSLPEAFGH